MDYQIFSVINGFAGKYPLLDGVGIFFAEIAVFVLTALSLGVVKNRTHFFIQASIIVGVLLSVHSLLGVLFFRERPFESYHVVQLISQPPTMKSFPSDHAGVAFAIATLLFLFHPRWGYYAYGFATLIALGRIYVGVHYPSDVLAGAMIGILITLGVSPFFKKRL